MVLLRVFMLRAVLLLTASVALAACDVGEVDIGGGGTTDAPAGSTAKSMMFDSTIKPMMMTMGCLATGCHSGLQVPIMNSYTSLAAKYKTGPNGANNILVTKGGTPPPGIHSARPYFDATQRATIASWIDMAE
jgi:hypothetical protein